MNFLGNFDGLIFLPILLLVMVIFFLSFQELKKSFFRDRDMLQAKLDESTKELREQRIMRLNELGKAAEFGRLSQGLFHDLLTPLSSVILHTEHLKENETAHRSVAKAVEAGHRMAQYAKEVRSILAREETERECLLAEELESMLKVLAYRIRQSGVTVALKKDLRLCWHGNPLKLRQVFSNLISNALDACEEGGTPHKRVEITLRKDEGNLVIEIEDNGTGIPPENISRIFDPFFTTKDSGKGTGIGLATVKAIVEKDLKGSIEVRSEMGKGSVFTIYFPETT